MAGGELVRVGQLGEGVHGGVHAVGAVHAGDPGDHLFFELGELADVVDQGLLVELGDGFGSQWLLSFRAWGLRFCWSGMGSAASGSDDVLSRRSGGGRDAVGCGTAGTA